jgi:hypothetical protein
VKHFTLVKHTKSVLSRIIYISTRVEHLLHPLHLRHHGPLPNAVVVRPLRRQNAELVFTFVKHFTLVERHSVVVPPPAAPEPLFSFYVRETFYSRGPYSKRFMNITLTSLT